MADTIFVFEIIFDHLINSVSFLKKNDKLVNKN